MALQMTKAEYQAKYGSEPFSGAVNAAAHPERSFFDKTLDFAQGLPTAPLGNAIGRSVRGFAALAQGDTTTFKQLAQENNREMPKVFGSALYSAAAPATFAVGGAPSVLGTAAKLAAAGAATTGSASIAKGNDAGQVIKDTAIGGAVGAAAGGMTKLLGKFLEKTGDKITTSVIKPSRADIEDGFAVDTIKKYNLGGSLKQSVEKTDKVMDDLSRQLNEKLHASNASINLSQTYEATAKKLLGNRLENFGSNSSMEKALDALRSEVVSSAGENGLVSIPQAQTVKRASGHLGAWIFGQSDPDSTARQKVYTTFYRVLKEQIEKNSPEGVKEINQELSKLIPVMNSLIRRIPVAERSNVLSLTDIITLTGAVFEPRTLALSLANFASKSGVVGNALSKTGSGVTGVIPAAIATNQQALSSPLQTQSPQSIKPTTYSNPTTLSDEHKQLLRKTMEEVSPGGAGGAIRKVTPQVVKKLANIHPDDLRVVERFIDAVRLKKGEMADALFDSAEKLAQKFGISMDKGLNGVANAFDDILQGKRPAPDTVVQPRDAAGRFK